MTDPDINDTIREQGADAVRQRHDCARKHNGGSAPNRPSILSKREFIKSFEPPDYLIDGVLQHRFLYGLTGATGHAKTAIALHVAELISSRGLDQVIGGHVVDKGRVAYMAGENPDDLRMRVIGADSFRGQGAADDTVVFIPGTFRIPDMLLALIDEARTRGGFDLVIVDTSAA